MRSGQVSFGGIVKEVNLAYVPDAGVGQYVIVHAGFAISTLDEAEAMQVFEYLKQINELEELEGKLKYLDEYRDCRCLSQVRPGDSANHHPSLDHHGNLRRANPCYRQVWHR